MVVPFVWMITTAFKPQAEWITFPPKFLPVEPTLENFHKAAESLDIFTLYRNTLYIAFVKSFINLYVSCLAGYVFGKFDFRGKDVLFYMILATWIIPFEVYMIPLYLMVNQQGMADTRLALIIPELSSAYAIFMYRQFMFTIPNALIDAARIDGAGEWYIWHRIIIPLSIPVLATLAVFYFMWNFNDFLWPLIVLVSPKKFVLFARFDKPVSGEGVVPRADHGRGGNGIDPHHDHLPVPAAVHYRGHRALRHEVGAVGRSSHAGWGSHRLISVEVPSTTRPLHQNEGGSVRAR